MTKREKKKANNLNGYSRDFRKSFIDDLVHKFTTAKNKETIIKEWKTAVKELKKRNYSVGSKSSYMSEIRKICKEKLKNEKTRIAKRRLNYILDVVHIQKKEREKLRTTNEIQVLERQETNRKVVSSVSQIVERLNKDLKGEKRFNYIYYAYIITLCTGRRTDEIFKQGEFFKPISKNKILFSGQSKKGENEIETYEIPCLFLDAKTVCNYIKRLHQLKPIPQNKRVNTLVSPHLNKKLKEVLKNTVYQKNDKGEKIDVSHTLTMHSLRGIYAMYCVEHLYERDGQGQRGLIKKLLGHEDIDVGKCYEDYLPKK